MRHYSIKSTDLLEEFNSQSTGLTDQDYRINLEKYGLNELKEKEKDSILKVFLNQFKDFLVIVLLFANLISILTNNIESAVVIMVVIILNAILGTVQYVKAERSLDSLKALSSPITKVIRNGVQVEISSNRVVPGDIVLLEAGDYVPADGRILENFSLQVNESSLTGESENVLKTSNILPDEDIVIGDRLNMVFSGSLVTYGRAKVLITSTGMDTEIGKIANLLETTQSKETPLQRSLDNFSKKLAVGIFLICILVFALTVYRGEGILDSLMFAVALAVAAIPEALSSIVTIVLAIGTQNMAKENAIMKELKAVEGLGSVSVICSDKTGTLTQNRMTVLKTYTNFEEIDINEINTKNPTEDQLIKACVLCNDSQISEDKEIGDPTETALIVMSNKLSIDVRQTRLKYRRTQEIPFDSERKLMSTVNAYDGKEIMYTKGAVDVLLNRITSVYTDSGIKPIDDNYKEKILKANEKFSMDGLRVLAFTFKEELPDNEIDVKDEYNLTFIGLVAMIDPPREEAKEAVADCKTAGIKAVMITGDHKITASSIAKQIGIFEEGDMVLTGEELEKMPNEDLIKNVENISVYARVSPEHKIKIVKAWQEKDKIVAMTGDGVNDAPALKQADIGIAMGITGTDVSKDAASMILTDDNFATIVKAISSGRNIFRNITNAIGFLLSGNAAAIIVVLFASIFALPVPFLPVHLLFINLLTDSLPAIAIGMEPVRKYLLHDKPRDAKASILDKPFLTKIAEQGILISIVTILAFQYGRIQEGADLARTMAFATLSLSRLFHGFNCRGNKSIFKLGVFANKASWISFIVGNILLLAVLKLPALASLFSVSELSSLNISVIYLLAFIPTLLIQVFRLILIDKK